MRDPVEDAVLEWPWGPEQPQKPDEKKPEDVKPRKRYTPQKIRAAFEYNQPDRYQKAYEAIRDIMQNSAIPRNKKVWSIGMMIDAVESGIKRHEKQR